MHSSHRELAFCKRAILLITCVASMSACQSSRDECLAHQHPSLRPLPPGKYGARCFRGPHFEASGFGDERCDHDGLRAGIALVPSLLDLRHWAKLLVLHGECGSWSPWRSQVVQWSSSDSCDVVNTYENNRAADGSSYFYYKAADCGAFDLSYDP